jgi:hypothetical protein
MRAIKPQNCRAVIVWRSRATHAPEPAVTVRGLRVGTGRRAGNFCVGNEMRRRTASSRAPDLQVAAPGARGEAARALSTVVASARPRVLRAWPSASRAAWEAAATHWRPGAIFDSGSSSSRRHMCVEPGFDARVFLQVESAGRRTAMRRRRRARSRLPGRRAARRARGRGSERLSGRCTPAPCHDPTAES